jgi:hypothetical protein
MVEDQEVGIDGKTGCSEPVSAYRHQRAKGVKMRGGERDKERGERESPLSLFLLSICNLASSTNIICGMGSLFFFSSTPSSLRTSFL